MTPRSNAGFTLTELLIAIIIIGILAVILVPNLVRAREAAHDAAAQGYLRHVAHGVEIKRIDGLFRVPAAQSCAALAGKPTDPKSVRACTYEPAASGDRYTITVESVSGKVYVHDGVEISVLE